MGEYSLTWKLRLCSRRVESTQVSLFLSQLIQQQQQLIDEPRNVNDFLARYLFSWQVVMCGNYLRLYCLVMCCLIWTRWSLYCLFGVSSPSVSCLLAKQPFDRWASEPANSDSDSDSSTLRVQVLVKALKVTPTTRDDQPTTVGRKWNERSARWEQF